MVHGYVSILLLLTGCTGHKHAHLTGSVMETPDQPAVLASENCESVLDAPPPTDKHRLNPVSIELFNWNTRKHIHAYFLKYEN